METTIAGRWLIGLCFIASMTYWCFVFHEHYFGLRSDLTVAQRNLGDYRAARDRWRDRARVAEEKVKHLTESCPLTK